MRTKIIFSVLIFTFPFLLIAQIPFLFDKEYPELHYQINTVSHPSELPVESLLPDPFRFLNGQRSAQYEDWEKHRYEISQLFQQYEIGMRPITNKSEISAVMEIADSTFKTNRIPAWDKAKIGQSKTLKVTLSHNDENLTISCFVLYPEKTDKPCPALLGIANCLPPQLFLDRGCAIININVFDVCSHTQKRGQEPINKLYPELIDNGSYSFWGWCVSRVIDALQMLGEEQTGIDTRHLAISGCSWAGKCALYAGAFDERICLVIPQEPGGGGIASWRYSETLGEVERSFNTNDAWFYANIKTDYAKEKIALLPIDHHELAAMVCPRALLYFGNSDYKWLADESGYVSVNAAKEVYRTFGIEDRVGYSISSGHGHCQLPDYEWKYVEAYIDRFMLEKDNVSTEIAIAPMFEHVDWRTWISNWR